MTGAQLKTMTESILGGDTVDETFFYDVLNGVKNRIEDERSWMFLRTLDSSDTASAGNNATTSHALPSDWKYTYKLQVGDDLPYFQVPFEQQYTYRNHGRFFTIDVGNSVYYLLGNVGKADTIYHYYLKTTDDIASGTEPTWESRFHPILAYETAGYIMLGQDADDIFARMSPENKAQARMLKDSMYRWDDNLQYNSQNGRVMVDDYEAPFDLGSL